MKKDKTTSKSTMVAVPFLTQPSSKAPAVDPHLLPGSVSVQPITFGDLELPPVIAGVQPGLDLNGDPRDYDVRVMWASRKHIDSALKKVEAEHADTVVVMEMVRAFICHIDSIRDSALLVNLGATQALKAGRSGDAIEQLTAQRGVFGRWNDEHRLFLH